MEKCPNCSADLESHFLHCPACGQTTDLPRFRIRDILDEFAQAIFSVDRGVLFLIRNLATQPGVTAREYVLEKKRRKYFNPFSFLLLILGLNLSVNVLIKPYTAAFSSRTATGQSKRPNIPPDQLRYVERRHQATVFIEENINVVGLAAIPLFAFIFWLCFRRSDINYAEHLVAQVFFSSFFSLFSIVLTLTLGLALKPYLPFLNRTLLLFQLVYLSVAYYQFLNYSSPVNYLKTSAATVLALISWIVVSGSAVFLYVKYGL
ncbi:DUF3667 domain-containing protein [Spirosoma sp.]|uniref:DUF3667 domain-containing protein n=1 Tax=Spirosoma sp. TaxID=1899569 RepID=UPI003B3B67CB